MRFIIAVLFLTLCTWQLHAQELKDYLHQLTSTKTTIENIELNSYANAAYAEAYTVMVKTEREDIPYYQKLLSNSIVYQRDAKIINENLSIIPSKYQFYVNQPQMSIKLVSSTSVPLDKNLFEAVLMNNTDTITIMLDTGGSGVGISQELVEKYDMKRDTTIVTRGSLPAFDVTFFKHPVIIPQIKIGDMFMKNIPAEYSVIDPTSTGEYTGPKFDMIIGLDTYIGYLAEVTFDWKNNMLEFHATSDMHQGIPFLFYNSKPFTSFKVNNEILTTILDTGAPNDLFPKEVYLTNYTKKEEKTYGQYSYTEYTVEFEANNKSIISLDIGDYNKDLNLEIGGEKIDLLIGYKHNKLAINLEKNIFQLN